MYICCNGAYGIDILYTQYHQKYCHSLTPEPPAISTPTTTSSYTLASSLLYYSVLLLLRTSKNSFVSKTHSFYCYK